MADADQAKPKKQRVKKPNNSEANRQKKADADQTKAAAAVKRNAEGRSTLLS